MFFICLYRRTQLTRINWDYSHPDMQKMDNCIFL